MACGARRTSRKTIALESLVIQEKKRPGILATSIPFFEKITLKVMDLLHASVSRKIPTFKVIRHLYCFCSST
jgi:hypothetical protein